jgi:ABC-type antimicrobial peptide transport system permease subunit
LSVIGIAVGIAAVMTVNAVSTSGRLFVMKELETFGLRSVWVYRAPDNKDSHKRARQGTGINNHDLKALQGDCCPAIRLLSPVVTTEKNIVQADNRYSNAQLLGVNADFLSINNDHLRVGRSIRDAEIRGRGTVAIIGETVVRDLFPESKNPVGRNFRIAGREYRVISILQSKNRDLLASIGSAGGDVNNRILGGVTIMGIVAASTALLVGAISVAGIMSTAVAERTREIGIRAAIGAHRWHIMTQFVTEAILISLMGGLVGLLIGVAIGGILDVVAGFPLLPSIEGILVALMVSIFVGLAVGYIPARRAAQMKPVDALRVS